MRVNLETFINDIPESTARMAYGGISFTPEKRAASEREGYAALMLADWEHFNAMIRTKPELRETMEAEFARYREGYRSRLIKKLHSDSRCVSSMIAGPSNFPVRRMEKRNNVAHKRLEELLEFRKRAIGAITKKLCPELRPIMAGDADAVQSLEKKIGEAERLQERMRTANATIRKYKKQGPEFQVRQLVSLGFTEQQSRTLLEPDFCGRIGFADYQLTNNNANIRRMKERLEVLKRDKATVATEQEGDNARVEDCPADNRIRLFFPGKPAADVRERLKSCGFRWTPSLECWQAYRNFRSRLQAYKEAAAPLPDDLKAYA